MNLNLEKIASEFCDHTFNINSTICGSISIHRLFISNKNNDSEILIDVYIEGSAFNIKLYDKDGETFYEGCVNKKLIDFIKAQMP